MKNILKLTAKYIYFGISYGCTFFVLICLAFFAVGGEASLSPVLKDFTGQALGAIAVGIACGTTAIVYQFHRLSRLAQTAIHFCIGMGVFFPTAIHLGWIPFYPERAMYTVMQFLFSCGIFTAIWSCFYFYNRREARRINNRLKELEQHHEDEKNKMKKE